MRNSILILLTMLALGAVTYATHEPVSEAFGYSSEDFGGGSYLGVDTRDITADRLSDLKLKEEHGVEVTLVDQDAPAASLRSHRPCGRTQADTSSSRFDFCRTGNLTQFDTPATSRDFQVSRAALHLDAAAAGLQNCTLHARDQNYAASAGLGVDFALS